MAMAIIDTNSTAKTVFYATPWTSGMVKGLRPAGGLPGSW